MAQAQDVAEPGFGRVNVAHLSRDLSDRSEGEIASHACAPAQGAADWCAAPRLEVPASLQPQLRHRVLDVVLHRIEADATSLSDQPVCHAMSHAIDHAP